MLISELEAKLKAIREEYGDLPVLMIGISGESYCSNTIEEIKPLAFPPFAKEGRTQFYVAALLNEGLL